MKYTKAVVQEWIELLREASSVEDVVAALGVPERSFFDAFKRHNAGRPRDYLSRSTIPNGHRVKGNSTLEDADGEVLKRWVKTERDSADPPKHEPVPPDFAVNRVSTALDGQGKVRLQWIGAEKSKATQFEQFWAACALHVERYRGLADPVTCAAGRVAEIRESTTVYPLGDPHFGMLAWGKETGQDFDSRIAERDLVGVVDELVARAPASRLGILANLGDFFHAQNDDQLTPAGKHKLDVDTRISKIADLGFRTMRRLTDRLLCTHDRVLVVNVPGNHDPLLARMLSLWMRAVYEREPRVEVLPNENPYMYVRVGKNLFGFAHGDGAKVDALPEIMATDRPEDWGQTLYRTWFTGHEHHRRTIEKRGCLVRTFGTLAPGDYWGHHRGFRSEQALQAITFDDEWGEVSSLKVDLRVARNRQVS